MDVEDGMVELQEQTRYVLRSMPLITYLHAEQHVLFG